MPALYAIIDNALERNRGVAKGKRRKMLGALERFALLLPSSSRIDCTPELIEWLQSEEGIYVRTPHRIHKIRLSNWLSLHLKVRQARKDGDGRPPIKVRRQLNAKLKSRGRARTSTYRQTLESLSDNTLHLQGTLPDRSRVEAWAWFDYNGQDWTANACSRNPVSDVETHDALRALIGSENPLTLDNGLHSLTFASPVYIESTTSIDASETTIPLLEGGHYYVGFNFAPNLQAAVKAQMPLVLVSAGFESEGENSRYLWRSTPFDLVFADNVCLSDCLLQIITQKVDGDLYSTCYLSGLGLNNQRYSTQLGKDSWVLRWNLDLPEHLEFQPGEPGESDSPDNDSLANNEDDFYLHNPHDYPALGDLGVIDAWLGGKTLQGEDLPAKVYASLENAQFLHLQFGISLPTREMTDVALTFRGTPTQTSASNDYFYRPSLFRVVVGQPFAQNGRFVCHDNQLHATVFGVPCAGFFEAQENAIYLCPVEDAQIPALAAAHGVVLTGQLQQADQLNLYIDLGSGSRRLHIGNDEHEEWHTIA